MYTKDAKTQNREWEKKAGEKSMSERDSRHDAIREEKDASRSADHKLGNVSEWDSVAESQNRIKSNKHESASE